MFASRTFKLRVAPRHIYVTSGSGELEGAILVELMSKAITILRVLVLSQFSGTEFILQAS